MLTTVRNNLFHGGKQGDIAIDDKSRNLQLLRAGKIVLDDLAQLAQFEADYSRYYQPKRKMQCMTLARV